MEADGTLKLDALHERGEASPRHHRRHGRVIWLSRVFTLTVGDVADPIIDAAKRKAAEWLGEKAKTNQEYSELGVTWLGTKALMWAIENQLDRKPGLYRWPRGMGQAVDLLKVDDDGCWRRMRRKDRCWCLFTALHRRPTGSFGDLQKISATTIGMRSETKFGESDLRL